MNEKNIIEIPNCFDTYVALQMCEPDDTTEKPSCLMVLEGTDGNFQVAEFDDKQLDKLIKELQNFRWLIINKERGNLKEEDNT